MRERKKQLIAVAVVAAIALIIAGYMKFFNGSFIYLTTGMKDDVLCEAKNQKTKAFQADILLADAKSQYENVFGTDIWSQSMDGMSFDDYVRDQVKTKLMRVRCMNVYAAEKGIVLSRLQKDAVSDAVDAYMTELSDTQISALGVTKESLTDMFNDFALAQEAYRDITSMVKVEISSDQARVITVQYICADTEEDINKALSMINSGESFYTVVKQYNGEDDYEYQLKRGEMDEAFEDAAYNLSNGEMSGVVKAGDKYYIIKCISDNDKAKTEANKAALEDQTKLTHFNEVFEEYESGIYVNFNKKVWENKKASSAMVIAPNFENVFNSYLK